MRSLVAVSYARVDACGGRPSEANSARRRQDTGVVDVANTDNAGSTVNTSAKVPSSVQGIWFVPGFGAISEEQVRLFGPGAPPGDKAEAWVSIDAAYYVGIALELTTKAPGRRTSQAFGWLEFSAGVSSRCVYEISKGKARLVSPGTTNQVFTSVVHIPPGGTPTTLASTFFKEPRVDCGDTVAVSMTQGKTRSTYHVNFWNLVNSQTSLRDVSHTVPASALKRVSAYWRVGVVDDRELSEVGNFGRTFCDKAWCKVGKKTHFANTGKVVPLTSKGKTLVTCAARAKGVLEFNCSPGPETAAKPEFENGVPTWKAPYHA
jgi:hypothetical protein